MARHLAPMISQFIRAQWESEELEGMDHERRQILEEAVELDHIWVSGRWRRIRSTVLPGGLGNHPRAETT